MAVRNNRTVGVFNASEDTVDMLIDALTIRGLHAIGGAVDLVKSGQTDLIALLEAHKPDAMIWDIAPPYDRNWIFAKLVRAVLNVYRCGMVVTTTNRHQLDKIISGDSGAVEIVGKPYDIEEIADRVEAVIANANTAEAGPRSLER
jgi:DNA-binding response OmpR family regulator